MDDLFIFLHIPKCAGNTIIRKLLKDVSSKEIFTPGYYPEGPDEPSDKFFGIDRMKNALETWARWNNPEKVRFIHSHHVYYGIHELFPDKKPFYIAFFRHPIHMVISYYNYGCGIPRNRYLSRTIYSFGGNPISFEKWILDNPYYSKEFLIGFLTDRGFDSPENDFSFLGFVDRFGDDFNQLCDIINLPRGFSNQNVSQNKREYPNEHNFKLLGNMNRESINLFEELKGIF
jgi:hypothetical protein